MKWHFWFKSPSRIFDLCSSALGYCIDSTQDYHCEMWLIVFVDRIRAGFDEGVLGSNDVYEYSAKRSNFIDGKSWFATSIDKAVFDGIDATHFPFFRKISCMTSYCYCCCFQRYVPQSSGKCWPRWAPDPTLEHSYKAPWILASSCLECFSECETASRSTRPGDLEGKPLWLHVGCFLL